ncbi:MAG: cupin domain-containing protein [Solirubrobacteraceae bacterium]
MSKANAFDAQFEHEPEGTTPPGYNAAEAPFGQAAGGKELTVRLFELPPGQNLCPYHYEYVEEWLLVMAGEVSVRTPTGVERARAGDIVCFPAGREGAHKVWGEGEQPARVVMFSATTTPAVAVYPDSDKVGVWTDDERDDWRFRGADAHLEYFDGESFGAH